MKQRSLFNLYLALTTGILSGARRVAMMLLATILFSLTAQPAWAETVNGVKYIDANGVEQTRDGVIVLTGSETTLGETDGTESSPTETWYLCNTNLSYNSTLSSYYYSNVNIILKDGVEMSVKSSSSNAIDFSGSLGIYGQSKGTNRGALTAEGTSSGIYANKDVTICSAEVTATATGTSGFAIYSDDGGVSITGGKVTAEGTTYAIGADGSDKDITIKDAEVTAEGNSAIYTTKGGISITGGKVTANGTTRGIYAENDVTIRSAEVTATANYAIKAADVSITGGKVTATGTSNGITAINDVTINNSEVTATGTYNGIHADNDVTISSSEVTAEGNSAISTPTTGGGVSITGGKVTANGTEYGIEAGGSNKDVTIKDAEVKAEGNYAIHAADVSITGGKVTANGTSYGIGAGGSGKDITIEDAEVTATADFAIYSSGGDVNITGGKVTATGTSNGITATNDVTISNSEVTATGTSDGIHADNDVTINSSEVTAEGNSAIYAPVGDVSIIGGKVTANGTYSGIRVNGSDKAITIICAVVEATANGDSGYAFLCYGGISITVGSVVTATGTSYGIAAVKDVTISSSEVSASGDYAILTTESGSSTSITGGTVTAKGTSYGVYGALTINGGTVSITGGSALSDINSYVANGGKVTLTSTSGDVYKVTFDGNEWSDIPEVSLYSGSTVAEPTAPVRNGYVFGGWKNGSTLYDFNMPVTANLTLVSVWKKLLTNDDIKVDAIEDQAYTGSALTPAVTVKDGETNITDQCDITYSDNTNVGTATVTITAKASSTAYTGDTTTTFIIVRPMENLFADGCSWTGYVAEEDLLLPDFLTAYIITALGEGTVTATPLDYVPKGEPVLLKRKNNNENSYAGIAGMGTAPTGNLLKVASASSQPTAFRDYGLYQDAFVLIGGGTLATGKVYLPVPQSQSRAANRAIIIDEETTSLRNVNVEIAESEEWFDLQGRKLDGKPAKKGVYIHNGKKEVVR